jgi:hypothetical protein
MLEKNPIIENATKEVVREEKSTTDSPLKDNLEGQQHSSPHVEMKDTMDEGLKDDGHEVVEHGPVVQDQLDQTLNEQDQQQQQDQNPKGNEDPSSQKSPSSDHADMGHYFESSNEEDISAQPGGSSIDPQYSTSKISAAAGIPESLLQGFLPQNRPSKNCYLEVASTPIVRVLLFLQTMMRQLGSNKHN